MMSWLLAWPLCGLWICGVALALGGAPARTAAGTLNTVETIITDMALPHEGYPHGVPPDWDWARRPRVNLGDAPGDFRAMTAWGQVYEDAQGNPATNTRVQVRHIRAYLLLRGSGRWLEVQNSLRVQGEAYVEDFSANLSQPGDVRLEADGTISVKLTRGRNFHFWPPGERPPVTAEAIAGVFTSCEARLIVDDPARPDDREQARYVLNMGGDYWRSIDARWAPAQRNNDDIGMGRFKYLTREWRAFNMCTVPAERLRQTPPPLE
jgi:hypothetical protein